MIFVYRVILILILIWQIQRIHLHLIMIDKCLNFFYLNFVPQISAQTGDMYGNYGEIMALWKHYRSQTKICDITEIEKQLW